MNSQPQRDDPQKAPEPAGDHLEEMTEHTAEVMADARKEVARAKATLHDQILPSAESGVEGDYEDREGEPDKEETRGGWPNWT